jgi:hypothetical protein
MASKKKTGKSLKKSKKLEPTKPLIDVASPLRK